MRRLVCSLTALALLLSPFEAFAAGRGRPAPAHHASPQHAAARPRSTHARTPVAKSKTARKTHQPARKKTTVTKQSAIPRPKPAKQSPVAPVNSRVHNTPPAVAHKKSNNTLQKTPLAKPAKTSQSRTIPASPRSSDKKTQAGPRKNSPKSTSYRDQAAMPNDPAPAKTPAAPMPDPNQANKPTETGIAINIVGLLSALTAPADPRAPAWQWAPQPVEVIAEPGAAPLLGPYQQSWAAPFPPPRPNPPAPSPAPPAPAPRSRNRPTRGGSELPTPQLECPSARALPNSCCCCSDVLRGKGSTQLLLKESCVLRSVFLVPNLNSNNAPGSK